jgi:diguanylate cyclase (GGDEF)-like protein/PAS domain S-box-containing protein
VNRDSQAEFLRTLDRDGPVGLFRGFTDGRTKLVNARYRQIFGIAEDVDAEAAVLELIHEQDLSPVIQEWQNFVAGKGGEKFTTTFRLKGDSPRWITIRAMLVREEEEIQGFIGTAEDVTSLRLAEDQLESVLTELSEREKFITRILDTTPDIVYVVDVREKRNVYVNREIGAIMGYSAEEIQELGANLFPTIIHPEDMPECFAQQQRLAQHQGDGFLELEYRVLSKTGQVRWLRSRDTIFERDEDGNPTHVLGIAQDITESRIFAEQILESQEQFQATLNSLNDQVYILDRNLAFVGFHRPPNEELFLPLDKFINRVVGEIEFPSELGFELRNACEAMLSGQSSAQFDYSINRAPGTQYYSAQLSSRYNFQQEFDGLTMVVRNITDRVNATLKLAESEARFRKLIDTAPMMVWLSDASGASTYVNQATVDHAGLPLEELLGYQFESLIHTEDRPAAMGHLMQAVASKSSLDYEFRIATPTGYRWISGRANPRLSEEGVFLGLIGSHIDVHERRQAQEEAAKHADKLKDFALRLAMQREDLEQANARLASLSTTDGLTQLRNHRAFKEHFAELIRGDQAVTLLVIDIDHFKKYNDDFGHAAGDFVLSKVGAAIGAATGKHDFAARYGGEEFCVVMTDSLRQGLNLAEKIHAAVKEIAAERPITVSVGVASRASGETGEGLFERTDAALYEAKRAGRNRTVVSEAKSDAAAA